MYNGVGLVTSRGSGTNGFVQKNAASMKHGGKDKVEGRSEEDGGRVKKATNRQPSADMASHELKRQIELKCMEYQEYLEEQGYPSDLIEKNVGIFRNMLIVKEGLNESSAEKENQPQPAAKETPAGGDGSQEKSQRLKDGAEGSTADPTPHGGEEEDASGATAVKRQGSATQGQQGATSEEEEGEEEEQPVKRKKKKSRGESSSPERGEKRQKHKKHRHSRSQ